MNPLVHYNMAGWQEGRDPSVGFDTTGYLAANPDVAAAQINPLLHYLLSGMQEGRSPMADGIWG
jgi:serralysin